MRSTRYLLVLVLVVFGTIPSYAATFKALKDFASINPNGTWSYGSLAKGDVVAHGKSWSQMADQLTPPAMSAAVGGFR